MGNNNLLKTKKQSHELAYSYDSIGIEEVSAYESSQNELSDAIAFINYKEFVDEELVRFYTEEEDESAFNEIVDRYGWKIHSLAFRITHDMRNADDVLQEVFLILVEKLHTYRQEAKFSTWLYKVAVNASLLFLRQQKMRELEISLESHDTYDESGYFKGVDLEDWNFVPDRIAISREGLEKIEEVIREMPRKYRVVFHLSHVDNLRNAEIGEILGLTLPAVKSRVRRAKLFLKGKLSENSHTA